MQVVEPKAAEYLAGLPVSVEFYPSVEDQVHIALRFAQSSAGDRSMWAYHAFLTINAVAFPAFLLLQEYIVWAAAVFLINLTALLFVFPQSNRDSYSKYYETLFGNRENVPARVELTNGGVMYTADGGYSFWPWERILSVEETDESIFFYIDGNGFGVRKSGFAYRDDERSFFEIATARVGTATVHSLPK
jgi:hypothetical protein